MKLKVLMVLFGLAFFCGAAVQTQEAQNFEVSVAYSYVRYNPATFGFKDFSMNGGSASVAYNFKNWLAGVADFGGYNKQNILGNGISGTINSYLFGRRICLNHSGRYTPFAQVLVGLTADGLNEAALIY